MCAMIDNVEASNALAGASNRLASMTKFASMLTTDSRRRRRIRIDAFAINPRGVAVCAAATLPLTTSVTSTRDIALIDTP
jgi:hypothetical protein